MKGLHIDPDRRVAWAQPGLTAKEYTVAAAAHGLATPFGDTGSVGIAGLTLGGGIGWLVRKYGLAIDALEAVEIVTADGRQVTASADSHPDLFWAVRGGGGNFGVVTRFQFKLYPVGEILGGALFMPATRDVLRSLVPIAASAPEELTTISFLMALPPAPFVPAELVGTMSLAIMFVYTGDPADGPGGAPAVPRRRHAARRHGHADAVSGHLPDARVGREARPGRPPLALPEHARRRRGRRDPRRDGRTELADDDGPAPGPGRAMARVGATDATAFAHRDAAVMATIITLYEDPSTEAAQVAWTEALHEELAANDVGVYSNFLEAEGEERIRAAYPAGTYERLADVKRRYDPANLFHLNQNIRPAAHG